MINNRHFQFQVESSQPSGKPAKKSILEIIHNL